MACNFWRDRTPIGLFKEDEEQREGLKISPEELAGNQAGVLGVNVIPNKTEKEAANALSLMNEELSKIPLDQKRCYVDAVEKCTNEVNNEKRMAFLWREDFDAKRAAARLVKYWEKRKELFAERCYLPLTLRILEDEIPLISTELFHLLPSKDSSGRAILSINMSLRDKSKNSVESVARVLWYFFHCLIEDLETQKRGFVLFVTGKHSKYNNFDPSFIFAMREFERDCFPIRCACAHVCHPRPFLRALLPVMKYVAGRHWARVFFHSGSDQVVMENLRAFGIAQENIPAHSGGRLAHDHAQWMCDRLQIEEQRKQCAGTNVTAAAFDVQEGELHRAEKRAKRSHDSTPHEGKSAPVALLDFNLMML